MVFDISGLFALAFFGYLVHKLRIAYLLIGSSPFSRFAYCSLSRQIRGRSYRALLAVRVWRRECFHRADKDDLRPHLLPEDVTFFGQLGFVTLIEIGHCYL